MFLLSDLVFANHVPGSGFISCDPAVSSLRVSLDSECTDDVEIAWGVCASGCPRRVSGELETYSPNASRRVIRVVPRHGRACARRRSRRLYRSHCLQVCWQHLCPRTWSGCLVSQGKHLSIQFRRSFTAGTCVLNILVKCMPQDNARFYESTGLAWTRRGKISSSDGPSRQAVSACAKDVVSGSKKLTTKT